MKYAALGLLAFLCAVTAPAQTIEVSPTGSIHTLTAARDAARSQRRSGHHGTIHILLHEGVYFLPETLVLSPEDSDTSWEAAHGEHPIISGGRLISGWKHNSGPVWTADAPGAYFHQLFVNGDRVMRSRTPKNGFLRFEGSGASDKPMNLHYRGDDIKPEWAKDPDIQIVGSMVWSDFRSSIQAVDPASHTVSLSAVQGAANEEDARYAVENDPSALKTPGTWHLERSTHTLSYIPRAYERMQQAQVIAPALERLIFLQGNPATGTLVHDVGFHGLRFMHTDWTMSSPGYFDQQAATTIPASIEAVGTEHLKIEHCTFAHGGGYGVELGIGTKHNQMEANEFYDLGAGGIKVGVTSPQSEAANRSEDNVLSDNDLHDLGKVYPGAVAILVLQSERNQITHNHLHDLSYTAISVGWTWGYGPSQAAGNIVEFNHIHAIGKGALSDMGGIYTLGTQPGTIVRNNLIHDISTFTYGGWGIYLDEGSSQILVQDNIVYGCDSSGFHQHYGRDNVIRNNIFAQNRDYQVMRSRAEDHNAFTFEENIVYFSQGEPFGGAWSSTGFTFRRNLYFNTRTSEPLFAGRSFAEWQQSGQDKDSVIADPLFVNAEAADYRMSAASPARKMGITDIDLASVGPRSQPGSSGW